MQVRHFKRRLRSGKWGLASHLAGTCDPTLLQITAPDGSCISILLRFVTFPQQLIGSYDPRALLGYELWLGLTFALGCLRHLWDTGPFRSSSEVYG